MKIAAATTAACVALLQTVSADFDVYKAGIGGNGIAGNAWGWQIYDGQATCDNNKDWIWENRSGVSGGKKGVRCKGNCEKPSEVDIMEFNFDSKYHWTTYKDWDWKLYDTSNNVVGDCSAAVTYPNSHGGAGLGRAEGLQFMHCVIDGVTAADINTHRP